MIRISDLVRMLLRDEAVRVGILSALLILAVAYAVMEA